MSKTVLSLFVLITTVFSGCGGAASSGAGSALAEKEAPLRDSRTSKFDCTELHPAFSSGAQSVHAAGAFSKNNSLTQFQIEIPLHVEGLPGSVTAEPSVFKNNSMLPMTSGAANPEAGRINYQIIDTDLPFSTHLNLQFRIPASASALNQGHTFNADLLSVDNSSSQVSKLTLACTVK